MTMRVAKWVFVSRLVCVLGVVHACLFSSINSHWAVCFLFSCTRKEKKRKERGNFRYLPELPPVYTKLPRYEKTLRYPPSIFQILSLRTLLEKSTHYTLHSKTTPFCPKRRSFGPFLILVFFFFLRRNFKKKLKKKGNRGWLEPPPCPKMGWPDHPLFGQGVASATPRPLGVVRPPRKPPRKKKKNEMGLCRWGWSDHPQGPGCGRRGWPKPPQALGGGPATPNGTNPVRFFFFFSWWLSGWPDHPQRLGGGRSHPILKATPFLGKGVAPATPDFPFFFFFF
jgi:hypothetical protein